MYACSVCCKQYLHIQDVYYSHGWCCSFHKHASYVCSPPPSPILPPLFFFSPPPPPPPPPLSPPPPPPWLTNVQFDAAYFISLSPNTGSWLTWSLAGEVATPRLPRLHFFFFFFFFFFPPPSLSLPPPPPPPPCCRGRRSACIALAVWSIVSDFQQTNWPLGIYWQQTPQRQTQSWEHGEAAGEGREGVGEGSYREGGRGGGRGRWEGGFRDRQRDRQMEEKTVVGEFRRDETGSR